MKPNQNRKGPLEPMTPGIGAGFDGGDLWGSLEIRSRVRRTNAPGVWVTGGIAGHQFEALVFPFPADHREWEVRGDSRISKLWLVRNHDRTVVYGWDRGLDIEPQNDLAASIVDLLASKLAQHIWE